MLAIKCTEEFYYKKVFSHKHGKQVNSSRKLDISGDQNSVKEIGKHMALVQQFESLLLSSYSKGVKDFSIL